MCADKIDPKKAAEIKQVTSKISAEIRADFNDDTITIKFKPLDEESRKLVEDRMLVIMPRLLAQQLGMVFGITGELINVKKRD